MVSNNGHLPAYPGEENQKCGMLGITKREYMAGTIMQGFITGLMSSERQFQFGELLEILAVSLKLADKMLDQTDPKRTVQ